MFQIISFAWLTRRQSDYITQYNACGEFGLFTPQELTKEYIYKSQEGKDHSNVPQKDRVVHGIERLVNIDLHKTVPFDMGVGIFISTPVKLGHLLRTVRLC